MLFVPGLTAQGAVLRERDIPALLIVYPVKHQKNHVNREKISRSVIFSFPFRCDTIIIERRAFNSLSKEE